VGCGLSQQYRQQLIRPAHPGASRRPLQYRKLVPERQAQASAHISDALDELATHDPTLAELVDLKFFCGFSLAEIAAMRDVSERTVKRNLGEEPHLPAPRARGTQPASVASAPTPSLFLQVSRSSSLRRE
jgi:hypothetical protein